MQRGERLAPGQPWRPFTAEQAYSFEPPGFLWRAWAKMAPLVSATADDSFLDHRGRMVVRLLGLLRVVDAHGPEIDQGAALRFWGEVLSFPEAVLHPALSWEALDDHSCRMRVAADRIEAAVELGAEGFPVATHADRYRDVRGARVLTPWSGRMLDWRSWDGGRMFPARWESAWRLPEGEFTAVRIETLAVRTE